MNAALSRLLFAGTIVPAVMQGQTIAPTEATISLYEQPGGQVLGADKRVYTNYFNTLRTRSVAVAVTLKYPAAGEASRISVGCQMTRPDGRVVEGIWRIPLNIVAGSTTAVGANVMFGAGKDGWQTGVHKVTCAATSPLGETFFQMSPGPSLLGDLEFRLTDVKFFLTPALLTPAAQRKYSDWFLASEATRIAIELTFLHPALARGGQVPVDCYYLSPGGRILGIMNMTYEFEPPKTTGSVAVGLGWEQPGQWATGNYLAICQMHGRPIVVERFTVR